MIYLYRIPKFWKALQKKKKKAIFWAMCFLTSPAWNRVNPFSIQTQVYSQLPQSFSHYWLRFRLCLLSFFLHETSFTCAWNSCVCPDGCHILICALGYTLPLATNLSLNSGIFSFCSTIEFFLVKKLCILKKIRYTCVQYLNSPLCIYCVIYNM